MTLAFAHVKIFRSSTGVCGESLRRRTVALASCVLAISVVNGPVAHVSAAVSQYSISACAITTLTGVSQPSGTTVVNVPSGPVGTAWDVVYAFTEGASLYLGSSFAYLISTDPAGPVSFSTSVTPTPGYMIGSGTIAATAYSLQWYAYDDTAPNYSGPVLCQINVPAAGGGDGGDDGSDGNWDIEVGHYLTRSESSLPNTL